MISGAAITAVCNEAINGLILIGVGGIIAYVVGAGQSVEAGLGCAKLAFPVGVTCLLTLVDIVRRKRIINKGNGIVQM